jgi:hypothetical protein
VEKIDHRNGANAVTKGKILKRLLFFIVVIARGHASMRKESG